LIAAAAAVVIALALPATVPQGEPPGGLTGPHAVAAASQIPVPADPGPAATPDTSAGPAPAPAVGGLGSPILTRPRLVIGPDTPPLVGTEGAARGAPAADTLTGYVWPLAHPRLTLPFGPTVWGTHVVDGERFHDGADLATFCGDRITAAHDGVVLAAGRHFDRLIGWVGDLGPYFRRLDRNHLWLELPIVVVTDDGNGYRSMYAHFDRVVVAPGDHVRAGQLLGYEGATGHATGCHLHYGLFSPAETATFAMRPDVRRRMKLPALEIARIDPLQLLPPRRGLNAPAFPAPSLVPVP
jgi:murein DD-endopeptidase MepM/ murein hydrolase activator NlpD